MALAAFAAAGLFAWRAIAPLRGRPAAQTSPTPTDPWAGYAEGWTELPPPPEVRDGAAMVWTGSQLLVWGGYDTATDAPTSAGFAFEPVAGTWSALPPAPVARAGTKVVWTGREALFWGGGDSDGPHLDGVALDPTTGSWRLIPSAPISAVSGVVTAWTGSDLVVFGGGPAGDPSNTQGAAYDPSTDSWRRIADAPIALNAASGIWDGTEVIVFGSLLNGQNVAATDRAVGEAYDPATDTWRAIAGSTLSPQASSAVWSPAGAMFAWDYLARGAWYDAGTDSWNDVLKLPFEPGECYPDGTVVGNVLFAFYCGQVATFDTITGSWNRVTGGLTAATVEANGQTYQLFRFATLAPAGDVVALAAEGITVEPSGGPCYGCPGAPRSFWVYRPPSNGPSSA